MNHNMYKFSHRFFLVILVLTVSLPGILAQKAAIKNNLLYDATATPNLALEMALSRKTTLELGAGLNWFDFSDNRKLKHLLVQPELRWWTCDVFNGHFFGIHAHGAQFNVGGWDIPVGRLDTFKDNRYEGYLYGGGISYGYQWILSPRWNFEASIGGGYARIHYDKYPCTNCGSKIEEGKYNYWGVTKAALSLIYIIK
jgi:hypothetical protein